MYLYNDCSLFTFRLFSECHRFISSFPFSASTYSAFSYNLHVFVFLFLQFSLFTGGYHINSLFPFLHCLHFLITALSPQFLSTCLSSIPLAPCIIVSLITLRLVLLPVHSSYSLFLLFSLIAFQVIAFLSSLSPLNLLLSLTLVPLSHFSLLILLLSITRSFFSVSPSFFFVFFFECFFFLLYI